LAREIRFAQKEKMNIFEDNPDSAGGDSLSPPASSTSLDASSFEPITHEIPPGDPFTYGATHPQPYHFVDPSKSDLDVPWSWVNLILFGVYGFLSFVIAQSAFLIYYIATKRISTHPTQKEFQQFAYTTPGFAIGFQVAWYALLLLFFFLAAHFYYRAPFWQSLGWRKLDRENGKAPAKPWFYFLLGCAMSFVVMAITAKVKAPEHAPLQDMLKDRTMAFAFMGMAVLVAPMVEETLFRGYLYPVFARIISSILRFFGMASLQATNAGVFSSVILTGVLFGLLHGYQLGWSKAIVAALIGVGIVLTIIRSRAQTTFASFLMHLGYNSLIALITTFGLVFEKIPPPHP
jgi:membrane protease YdiL (CAAX protease family)